MLTAGRRIVAIVAALTYGAQCERAEAVDRTAGAAIPKPAATGADWSNRQKRRLGRDLDALLETAPTLHGAHVGLLVVDSRTGQPIYERAADDAFVPASTMKILTGSMALATLGPAYRFTTEAYVDRSGETLYVKAGGDPLLSSADVAEMARAAVDAGAFHAPFATRIDASAFASDPYPPGWSWDDFVYDYAPPLTPLPVDENAVELVVAPGARAGDPLIVREASSTAEAPASQLCAADAQGPSLPNATTGERGTPDSLDIVRRPPADCAALVGSLPLESSPETLGVAVRDPMANVARIVAHVAAQRAGTTQHADAPQRMRMQGALTDPALPYQSFPVPAGARRVWSHAGEPLSDLLADLWWPSDNFIAEMLLRAIGLHAGGAPGTTAHGADAERGWLASIGVVPATLTIADGSGLSTYDRLTPRALVTILQFDWNGPNRDIVLDDLPLAGVRGTLLHSFAGSLADRRTFAKTGSVSHARGLAGYLATQRHGAVTFAWSVDDWMGTNADLDALRARVLSRIIGD